MVPNPEQGLWNTSNPAKLRTTAAYRTPIGRVQSVHHSANDQQIGRKIHEV
jgi:hypothetical protein